MRGSVRIFFIIGALCCASEGAWARGNGPTAEPSHNLGDGWVGGLVTTHGGRSEAFLQVDFGQRTARTHPDEATTTPVERVSVAGRHLHFEIPTVDRTARYQFDGDLDAASRQVAGVAALGSARGRFELYKTVPFDPKSFSSGVAGIYRDGDDTIYLRGRRHPLMVLERTGQFRALVPIGPDTFVVGSGLGAAFPSEGKLTVIPEVGTQATRIEWMRNGDRPRTFVRADYRAEAFSVVSRGTKLAGSIVFPPGQGPYPAVVGVAGAGETIRDDLVGSPGTELEFAL